MELTKVGPRVIKVYDRKEALYIITEDHKQWCPHCNSKKCTRNFQDEDSYNNLLYKIQDRLYELRVCLCKNHKKYFLNDQARRPQPWNQLVCRACGSKKFHHHGELDLRLRPDAVEGPEPAITLPIPKLIFVDNIKCVNCKYDSVIAYAKIDINSIRDHEDQIRKKLYDEISHALIFGRSRLYEIRKMNRDTVLQGIDNKYLPARFLRPVASKSLEHPRSRSNNTVREAKQTKLILVEVIRDSGWWIL